MPGSLRSSQGGESLGPVVSSLGPGAAARSSCLSSGAATGPSTTTSTVSPVGDSASLARHDFGAGLGTVDSSRGGDQPSLTPASAQRFLNSADSFVFSELGKGSVTGTPQVEVRALSGSLARLKDDEGVASDVLLEHLERISSSVLRDVDALTPEEAVDFMEFAPVLWRDDPSLSASTSVATSSSLVSPPLATDPFDPSRSPPKANASDAAPRDSTVLLAVGPSSLSVKALVGGLVVRAVVDSGAALDVISPSFATRLRQCNSGLREERPSVPFVRLAASETVVPVTGTLRVPVTLGGKTYSVPFSIIPGAAYDCFLGLRFLRAHKVDIVAGTSLRLSDGSVIAQFEDPPPQMAPGSRSIRACHSTVVPPHSEARVWAYIEGGCPGPGVLAPVPTYGVEFPPVYFSPEDSRGTYRIRLRNLTTKPVVIGALRTIGTYEPFDGTVFQFIGPVGPGECEGVERVRVSAAEVFGVAGDSYAAPVNLMEEAISSENMDVLFGHVAAPDEWTIEETLKTIRIETSDSGARARVEQIVRKFPNLFGNKRLRRSMHNGYQHRVVTSGPPKVARQYRYAVKEDGVLREIVVEYEEDGIIEPAPQTDARWRHSVFLVPKPGGGRPRFVSDMRAVNEVTQVDTYPMPTLQDSLDFLARGRYYAKLDFVSSYFQVEVLEQDREKLTFGTPFGLYRYRRMTQGLSGAPASFMRALHKTIGSHVGKICMSYIDDLIVLGSTLEEFYRNLETILALLDADGWTLSSSKCVFLAQKFEFLGFIVSADGIEVDSRKVSAILEFPRPTSLRPLQRFIGMVTFYSRFLKRFAKVTSPLHKLAAHINRGGSWYWRPEEESSFTTLRRMLASPPVLAHPRPELGEWIVYTDACADGFSATLCQMQDGIERLIWCWSKSTTSYQRSYSASELELHALRTAVTTVFRPYLYGSRFVVYTDHVSLQWLRSLKVGNMRLLRYALGLQGYDFVVHYKKGSSHTNVDPPSRAPLPVSHPANRPLDPSVLGDPLADLEPDEFDGKVLPSHISLLEDVDPKSLIVPPSMPFLGPLAAISPTEMASLQSKDPSLAPFLDVLSDREPGTALSKLQVSMADHMFLDEHSRLWYRFFPRDNVVYRNSRALLVLPTELRVAHIDLAHNGGSSVHESWAVTVDKLLRYCWWPLLISQVRDRVLRCVDCQHRRRHTKRSGTAVVVPPPATHTRQWLFDLSGHLPRTPSGNEYVAMLVDEHSGLTHARAIPKATAPVIVGFIHDVFSRYHDFPELIRTDEGSNVTSDLFREVVSLYQSQHRITLAYVHDASGVVERKFRVLWDKLSKLLGSDKSKWDEYLGAFQGSILHATSATRGETPFRIVYGRDPISPAELALGLTHDESREVEKKLNVQRELVRQFTLSNVHEYRRKNAAKLDRKRNKLVFKAEDMVLVDVQARIKSKFKENGTHISPKLARDLSIGPFRVIKQDGARVYLKSLAGEPLKRAVHSKRVIRWFDAEPLLSENVPKVEFVSSDASDDDELVDLAHRVYVPRSLVFKTIDSNSGPRVLDPATVNTTVPIPSPQHGGSVLSSPVDTPQLTSSSDSENADPSSSDPNFTVQEEQRFVPLRGLPASYANSEAPKSFWKAMPPVEESGRGKREKIKSKKLQ